MFDDVLRPPAGRAFAAPDKRVRRPGSGPRKGRWALGVGAPRSTIGNQPSGPQGDGIVFERSSDRDHFVKRLCIPHSADILWTASDKGARDLTREIPLLWAFTQR